jgi:hypothetical protein
MELIALLVSCLCRVVRTGYLVFFTMEDSVEADKLAKHFRRQP